MEDTSERTKGEDDNEKIIKEKEKSDIEEGEIQLNSNIVKEGDNDEKTPADNVENVVIDELVHSSIENVETTTDSILLDHQKVEAITNSSSSNNNIIYRRQEKSCLDEQISPICVDCNNYSNRKKAQSKKISKNEKHATTK